MRSREELREIMIENAAEINRLKQQIDETFRRRNESEDAQRKWSEACREMHARYNYLCLPGGWDSGFLDRLESGETYTIEVALCFLEVRPYFFRSGYHWKAIFQKCKRAPMAGEQAERFADLVDRHDKWKQRKNKRK